MSHVPPRQLVVRCSVRDGAGAEADRVLLRVPAEPASAALDAVLRRALAERHRGRTLVVEAPASVAVLLALLGLGDGPGRVTP